MERTLQEGRLDHFGKGGSLCLFVVAGPQARVTRAQHEGVFFGSLSLGAFLAGRK